MKLKFTIFEKIKMLKSTFKNLKFLTKCKSGFPKISAMSFSNMKIKEFSKNLLKFSRPSTNLNLSIRNYHQNGRSWSDYIDDLFDSDFDVPSFTGPTILGTGLGLGYGVYNIVEYSQPLSENLPMSVGVLECWSDGSNYSIPVAFNEFLAYNMASGFDHIINGYIFIYYSVNALEKVTHQKI